MNTNMREVTTGPAADARLDGLTPAERAVFVLREAFSYGYREIAETLGLTETACRQLHRRARRRTAAHGGHDGTGARPRNDSADLVRAA